MDVEHVRWTYTAIKLFAWQNGFLYRVVWMQEEAIWQSSIVKEDKQSTEDIGTSFNATL